jgi:EAL domain-containing protein (putative c-di-GMP-specific phosphodiesterase class I)
MVNLALAFLFVKMVPIAYSSTFTVVWNTPVFLDGYLKSQGDLRLLGFQVFLLLIDVLIYLSFMRRFAVTQSLPGHLSVLAKNLDIKAEIESEKNLLAYQAYSEIIDANSQLDYILKDLQPKNMFIYYQPKINLSMGTSTEFEALIRYWNQGKMTGPIFLDTIEKAGMAPIIDLWVCQQVQYDLQKWHENNFYPSISINLHPDTLLNIKAIEHIRTIFEKKNVTFEIVERSFLDQNAAQENLQTLRDNHHRISIDDFGTGYSNLGIMIRLHIDELKLDKSLIDVIHTPKGYAICRGVIRYCHEVGIDVVAEGVETPQQVQILTELEVDTIQGFIYSKAIPFDQAYAFSHNFSKNHHKEKS